MKIRYPFILAFAALVGVCGTLAASAQGEVRQTAAMPLKVMTFNLRYASDQKPNSWPERRPVNAATLKETSPDLIGTQEGLYQQIKDMAHDSPDYDWIGVGRGGGSRDEFCAVFYRKTRLEPLEWDYFWLSDTPNKIASKSWGNRVVRMATWVKFRDLQSGQEFYFCDTHLDHEVQEAREKGAALIINRLNKLDRSLPLLMVGDFNVPARENSVYDQFIKEGFADSFFAAKERVGANFASFHGYEKPVPDEAHIDWILTRGDVSSESSGVVTFSQNGQYPSDHFPVMATLRVGRG